MQRPYVPVLPANPRPFLPPNRIVAQVRLFNGEFSDWSYLDELSCPAIALHSSFLPAVNPKPSPPTAQITLANAVTDFSAHHDLLTPDHQK